VTVAPEVNPLPAILNNGVERRPPDAGATDETLKSAPPVPPPEPEPGPGLGDAPATELGEGEGDGLPPPEPPPVKVEVLVSQPALKPF